MDMEQKNAAVVALGMFDGMHRGHTELIRHAVERAEAERAASVVFTFENHPLTVLGQPPRLLSTLDERLGLMRALGVDEVHAVPFTREFAGLPPDAFLDLIAARWRIAALVCGYNYTYGRRGAGTPDTLLAAGRARGFPVDVLPPVLAGGAPVSSSRIRQAIEAGDMPLAGELLGRPYSLSGRVVSNLQNGRRIGFPTANIEPDPMLVLPKAGVYHTVAEAAAGTFPAVTNVGANPTLRAKRDTVETHLIGFSGDLYGTVLAVSFHRYLRGEIAFDSLTALKARIAQDVKTVSEAAKAHRNGK